MKANIPKSKNKIFEKLNSITPMDEAMEYFIKIMELPDEQFNNIYPEFKDNMIKVFSSNQFRKEIINNSFDFPIESVEEEKKDIENFIEEIKKEESLSDNKKELLIYLLEQTVLNTVDVVKNPREIIKVKIERINPNAKIPTYAHDSDAGADIYAAEDKEIAPHTTELISTGIKVAIPLGYELTIRPRSGLSLKTSLRIANAPATIDADFRGEIKVIMTNIGDETEKISVGDRIGQFIISPIPMIEWEETTINEDTSRGKGGFGSTGN